MSDPWLRATSVAPYELVEPTLQLHWAAQYLASAGQTFVEPRSDDSHRSMTWSHALRSFVGEPLSGPDPIRVALRPLDLTLLLVGPGDDELGTLPLAGRTRDEGYEWLSRAIATYLDGPPPLIERPEYDMPEHPVMRGARFSTGIERELAALEALFAGAAGLLHEIATHRGVASPVRVWPHHFDIAALCALDRDADGTATKTVGIGLAPMGGGYDEWYAYVSPWPSPDPGDLPELEGPAFWHTQGWTGAVLTASNVAVAEPGQRAHLVARFYEDAIPKAEAGLG